MKRGSTGFTVIEILIVITVLVGSAFIIMAQKANIDATARDQARKVAINAMYYGLEEVYFKEHKNYPATINEGTLPSVDPALFTDQNGQPINSSESEYYYEGLDCTLDGKCKRYTLRANMEREATYQKTNRK